MGAKGLSLQLKEEHKIKFDDNALDVLLQWNCSKLFTIINYGSTFMFE